MKLRIGDKVKLNKNVENFKYGRSCVRYDEIGTIIEIDKYEEVWVNFPSHSAWNGLEEELVIVGKGKFFKKLPNDFTGTIEVENGYIVEKEILDEKEKEYLSNLIKPFKHKVEYITKVCYSGKHYINIDLSDEEICLPYFKKGTMYKGMEEEKEYTLEELNLKEAE